MSQPEQDIDIVDAYLKDKKYLMIFISGLSGSGKRGIAKQLARDFKMQLVDQVDYYKKEYETKTKLPNGVEKINWDTDQVVDWEAFNQRLFQLQEKDQRSVVVGFALPEDRVEAKASFHIHLALSKKACMERRRKYVEKHQDKFPEEFAEIGTATESLKMNKWTYPYYMSVKERSRINKFVNVNALDETQTYDRVFDLVVDYIEDYLYKDRPEDKTRNQTPNLTSELASLSSTEPEPLTTEKSVDLETSTDSLPDLDTTEKAGLAAGSDEITELEAATTDLGTETVELDTQDLSSDDDLDEETVELDLAGLSSESPNYSVSSFGNQDTTVELDATILSSVGGYSNSSISQRKTQTQSETDLRTETVELNLADLEDTPLSETSTISASPHPQDQTLSIMKHNLNPMVQFNYGQGLA